MQGETILWERLADDLAGRIARGEIAPGGKLPSISELCRAHRVSHITVRAALARLVADGLISGRKGAGYFCRGPLGGAAGDAASPQVAMVLPGRDPFFFDLLHGAEGALRQRDHRLVVAVAGHHADQLAERLRELLGTVRGFLIVPGRGGHDYRAWLPLLERRTPFIFLDHFIPGLAAPLVATDNVAGGRLATAHLLARGRRRIWVLAEAGFTSIEERIAGHRQALAEAGIAAGEARVLTSTGIGRQAGEELARRLGPELAPGDGVFALNEPLAAGAYAAVRARGWRPGREVAVVGFDDTVAEHFDPPLTTLAQDLGGLGAAAVGALFERLAAPGAADPAPPALRLPPRLVVRASCGAAAQDAA